MQNPLYAIVRDPITSALRGAGYDAVGAANGRETRAYSNAAGAIELEHD
jgi:hypothetical protein